MDFSPSTLQIYTFFYNQCSLGIVFILFLCILKCTNLRNPKIFFRSYLPHKNVDIRFCTKMSLVWYNSVDVFMMAYIIFCILAGNELL